MSALFSPIELRGLSLPNRIMVAPMCQYSADHGEATDWHFTHVNSLALSGAAMFCIEATAVEAIGRITHGCLGLWNDACEAALKPIVASVRRHSKTAVAMQLAHAGRKASSQRPWEGGQLIPLDKGGWSLFTTGAPAHEYRDPVLSAMLRTAGRQAWFGWPSDARIEKLRDDWMDATDEAEQKRLAAALQAAAFDFVPYVPLGQYFPPSAWRNNLSGLLKGATPVFWNVEKA